jgi:hypothetical protein|tara:strand:- start:1773 stop:2072 length:300 start_codon:yes stop_codon:yes gene_type:complete
MPDYGPKVDCALFKNKYKENNPKAPDKTGTIEMTRPFLKALVTKAKTGEMPVIRMAGWFNKSKAGVEYETLRLEISDKPAKQPESAPDAEADDGDDMPW